LIGQVAAEAALNGDQGCILPMVRAFRERHEWLVKALNAIDGVRCIPSDGTFYSFPSIREAIAKQPGIKNDVEMAEHILNQAGVALVPGSAFGAKGYIRLSFATSMDNLTGRRKAPRRPFWQPLKAKKGPPAGSCVNVSPVA
jgi:aspartate aminotransferase